MNNKANTGKADHSRINVNENYELLYWSEKFKVSRNEVRDAIKAAGPLVKDVKAYLSQHS